MTTKELLRIAIFGSGHMAQALAPHWARAGHVLTISGRTDDEVDKLAAELNCTTASWRAAAETADVILLAVHWAGVDEVLTLAAADEGTLTGKVVVDCGNEVEIENFTLESPGSSLAQRVQERTGARVVKAFNLAHAQVWADVPVYDGRALTVPVAGDDAAAKALVGDLVADVGAVALDVGDLSHAAYLEAMGAVIIRILAGGAEPTTVFNLVDAGHGATSEVVEGSATYAGKRSSMVSK